MAWHVSGALSDPRLAKQNGTAPAVVKATDAPMFYMFHPLRLAKDLGQLFETPG